MRRYPFAYSPFTIIMLWSDLAAKTIEMMLASAQVIAHRTTRMASAGHRPSAGDRREFALMGWEKVEATAKSAQAVTGQMLAWGAPRGAMAYRNWLRSYSALLSFADSRTPGQAIARQAELAQALGRSALGMANAAASATRLAHRGLKPVHAKAVANAKRLGKR